MKKTKRKKNPAAVELGKKRMRKLKGAALREFQSAAANALWLKRRNGKEQAGGNR